MKTEPVVPARIDFERGSAPFAPAFDDFYPGPADAQACAKQVYLAGTGLPARWAGQRRFAVLEAGFGLGHNFLATWQAWRVDRAAGRACGQLVFVSVELHPPTRADLQRAHRDSPWPPLAAALLQAWPPLTPNLHLMDFDGGQVRLLLAFGDARRWLRQLRLRADAVYLDGFAPRGNPAMWEPGLLKAVARLAAPEARLASACVSTALREGLSAAGFVPEPAAAQPPLREMTVARHAPRGRRPATPAHTPANEHTTPPTAPNASPPHTPAARQAVVIGAGIAGACAAAALARQGWACTVLDAAPEPASGASGNPVALFHGTVHADDGPHARFTRAAALHAQRVYGGLVAQGLPGRVCGLLRANAGPDPGGWPADWAQQLQGAALRQRAPALRADSAWWLPGGGWVDARAVVRALLATPGVSFRGGTAVGALARRDGGWDVLDMAGAVCARAQVLVLAAAGPRNADLLPGAGAAAWPRQRARGQVSWFDSTAVLDLPLAGNGYAVGWRGERGGVLLCGATTQRDDAALLDERPTEADHRFNLERLHALAGIAPGAAPLQGRVGWREATPDRLPVLGPAPAATQPPGTAPQRSRDVARVPGLFVLGAMGGRGFTWGPLAGEVLAAMIDGAPLPLEADLLDAVDPARWGWRRARRGSAGAAP